MARIVDMNELVPEDITIRYGRPPKDYVLPGDISVETVFRLFEMFQAVTVVESDDTAEVMAELRRRFGDLQAELLTLFQERDPSMTVLPFGIASIGAVLKLILGQLGLNVTATDPTPRPSTKKRAPARKR